MVESDPTRVVVDAVAAGHAALALEAHRRHLAGLGEEPPAAFKDLAATLLFVARSGQCDVLEVVAGEDRGDRLLVVGDAAAAAGVSPRTLRRRIAAGDLAVVRIGRRVLVRPEALDEFIDHCERGGDRWE